MTKIQMIEKIREALKNRVWTMTGVVLRGGDKYDVLSVSDIDKVLDAALRKEKS